jgi:hypothetical protein
MLVRKRHGLGAGHVYAMKVGRHHKAIGIKLTMYCPVKYS